MLGSDPHEHLSKALAPQQATERLGSAGEPVGDVFPIVEQTRADPTSNHLLELRQALQVVLNDYAAKVAREVRTVASDGPGDGVSML